ncbi:acyltransferase [Hymenobacter sp. BT523]|uniref:acyltransferase family protein n=1 Tax=Hymenobacter sp. BT523 TaxID=2795725 RepID=UPI0018EB04CA|nr:acyltransferase [Hymenobacter sp. BT523]MBJ6111070.1 acyltransferase [Hymenobacter sp. BT523]
MSSESNRIYGLDVLRAFAVLTVVLGHSLSYLPSQAVAVLGWLIFDGVTAFFVLSGFLIGGIFIKTLERNDRQPRVLLNFWGRRWMRTLPPYFLVLAALMVLRPAEVAWPAIAKYWVFLQNFRNPHPPFFAEAWSLSVEEWFYLLVPLAIFLLTKFTRLGISKAVLYTALAVLTLVTGYRYYKFLHIPSPATYDWDQQFRKIVITRLDSLVYGVVGAYLARYLPTQWAKHKKGLLLAGLALLLLIQVQLPLGSLFTYVFSFSLTSAATLMLLPYLSQWKTGHGTFASVLTHVSLISYPLYLVHRSLVMYTLVDPLGTFVSLPPLVSFGLVWLFSWGLSALLHKYFEVPIMQLRNRWL